MVECVYLSLFYCFVVFLDGCKSLISHTFLICSLWSLRIISLQILDELPVLFCDVVILNECVFIILSHVSLNGLFCSLPVASVSAFC